MKKRILLLYATYGTGHKTVALNIEKNFHAKDKELEILSIDLLDYSSNILGRFSKKINEYLMTKRPRIWSFLYKLSDGKIRSKISMKALLKMLENKELKKTICDFNPDLVINSHFYGPSLIAKYKKEGIINPKMLTIVTDYEAHEMWLQNYSYNEYLIVSSKEEKRRLIEKEIDHKFIKVNGIPITFKYDTTVDRKALQMAYDIDDKKLTCLFFAGGGQGSSKSLKYLKKIIKDKVDMNIIFCSGKNEAVKNKALEYKNKYNASNVKVLGYVNNVPDLMHLCDFVITKPGGLQITESLYAKKPVMLINGNGGQENANYRYFVRAGYGKRFRFTSSLSYYLKKLSYEPELLDEFVTNMKKADDKAMEKLYKLTKDLLKK